MGHGDHVAKFTLRSKASQCYMALRTAFGTLFGITATQPAAPPSEKERN
jgi:hypothetical protein